MPTTYPQPVASQPVAPEMAQPPIVAPRRVATWPVGSALHPLHVLLAAYPITCFSGAFVTDIAYANTAVIMWANFSVWLIATGLAMGVAAVIVGIIEGLVMRSQSAFRPGAVHIVGNALVLALSLWNAFIHSRDGWTSVVPTGIILSGVVTVLVIVVNWLGITRTMRQLNGGNR